MDLTPLLRFIPLIAGLVLAYHVIFRQQLPTKSLGAILTYFVGIVIVLLAVGLLIGRFFADWATDLLQSGTQSQQWQQFIDESENVFQDALDDNNTTSTIQPTTEVIQIVVTATPRPGTALGVEGAEEGGDGPIRYTVKQGDTLSSISRVYNTTFTEIMRVNGLTSDVIHPGQVLIIPTPSP